MIQENGVLASLSKMYEIRAAEVSWLSFSARSPAEKRVRM